MSLHQLANHVQSAGRGEDKVLVHMTPGEVGGLQSLAMAHGGSLTINPQTGLPEASFLRRLLPMIAGLALGPAGLGLSAMQAGLATAAVGTAATGSLGKGLMMGLGAYGGAGLGAGLKSMATPSTMTPAIPNAGVVTTPTTSTLGGSNVFAKVGAENLTTSADDILAQAAKNPNIASPQALAFKPYVTPGMTSSTVNQSLLNPNINFANVIPKPPTPPVVAPPPAPVAAPPVAAPVNVDPRLGGYAQSAVPGTSEMTMATPAVTPPPSAVAQSMSDLGRGLKASTSSLDGLKGLYSATEAAAPYAAYAGLGSYALGSYYDKLDDAKAPKDSPGLIRPYTYERTQNPEAYDMGAPMYAATPGSSRERNYFTEKYTALTPYEAPGPEYRKAAEGGVMGLAVGGPVEMMSAMNAVGGNTMYPQSQLQTPMYSNPAVQRPEAVNVISPSAEPAVGMYSGEAKFARGGTTDPTETVGEYKYSFNPQTMQFTQLGTPKYMEPTGLPVLDTGNKTPGGMAAPIMPAKPVQPSYTPPPVPAYQTPEQQLGLTAFYPMMEQRLAALGASQGYAGGGLSHLGDYSDGGRLLKGPGDGVSDSIPAVIGQRQPARLADGEFVVPARIVSEIGNGSTEAGARKLYAMMDRVQKARRKTVGKNKVAANTRSEKYLPA